MIPLLIGKINLGASAELRFEISSFKGKTFINIRKYVNSPRFTGYTKKGIALNPANAKKILEALQSYRNNYSTDDNNEICRISKNENTDIVVHIVPPDENYDKTLLDIREYVNSKTYTGWTKKGFRVSLDLLEDVIDLLNKCLHNFDIGSPLFSNDNNIEQKPKTTTSVNDGKSLIKEILNGEIPTFPNDFIPTGVKMNSDKGAIIELPPEPIYLGPMRGTKQEIISEAGYEYLARDPVEAKYIYYAHLNNQKQIVIPDEPFITFKIVKKYEVFIRNLQKKLINLLIRRIRDKNTAKNLAQKYFKEAKLPWIDEEL